MKKSMVTSLVTALFVIYSFYQRTIGVQASAGAIPAPSAPGISSGVSTSPGFAAAPGASGSNPTASQSSPTRSPAGNGSASVSQVTPATAQTSGSQYKDGTYTGQTADAFYGNLQVRVTITNGKVTNVQFPQWPNDRSRSVRINQQALPMLVQETIQAQSGRVDVISGATDTSVAFNQSLQSALIQAKG